jgi:hypothetical protein
MSEEYTTGLKSHIAALREHATQARRLANEVDDKLACEGLVERAEEFERRAQELEAQLALKQAAPPADPGPADSSNVIAALKPPGDKREGLD